MEALDNKLSMLLDICHLFLSMCFVYVQHFAVCQMQVVSKGIPMHARMIHSANGKRFPIPYGKKGQVGQYQSYFVTAQIYASLILF